MFYKFIKKIDKNIFIKNFTILSLGSIFSQLIVFFATPLLTRIYKPEIFGLFTLFIAISSTFSLVSSGRFNTAVVVAKNKNESVTLFHLSILITTIFSILFFFIIFIGENFFKQILNAKKLGFWWYFIPILIFLESIIILFKDYANRIKNYSILSKLIVFRVLLYVTIAVICGFLGYVSEGLFIAYLLSYLITLVFFKFKIKKFVKINFFAQGPKFIKTIKKFYIFPLNSYAHILNSLMTYIPIYFISKSYSLSILGYYALTLNAIFLPLSFISSSVSTINLRKVPELIKNRENLLKYFFKNTFYLTVLVTLPAIILTLYAPEICIFVFGKEWQTTGEFIKILMPSFAIIFVVSTLSPILFSTFNNHLYTYWNIISFLLTLLFFLKFSSKLNIYDLLLYLSFLNIFLYLIYYIFIFYSVKNPKNV